ncbi:MAG: hypothetical protein ACRDRA_00360 [Pseudonocardiaceae bacterium]
MSWYLQSIHDRDTHRADLLRTNGSVVAECGVEFMPRPLPFGRIALPGHPLDPDQPSMREDEPFPPLTRAPLPTDNGVRAR